MEHNHTRAAYIGSFVEDRASLPFAWIRRCNRWTGHYNLTRASRNRMTKLLASVPNRETFIEGPYTEINASYDK